MDYKQTLLLPNTPFAMRGNLTVNEPKRYKKWYDGGVYERMKKNRQNAELFTFHDGPPYANGAMHLGHALNKTLKDIVVKWHYFNGKGVRFTPGWDCHGLPIEKEVEKKVGGKAKKEAMSPKEIRTLCRAHAAKFVDLQREGFKTLGITADWDNPYLTMDYTFEANIYRTLCDIAQKGLLVERSKPVYWSWAERTALAEAEVEYEDKTSHSIYVAFDLSSQAKKSLNIDSNEKAALVIWTTTPWTLPANTAIALNAKEPYVLTTDGYIVASALYEALHQEGVIKGAIRTPIDAKTLERHTTINPLNQRESLIILGEHVTMDNGTGCVHTAPGHGEDDYRVGLLYDLEVLMPVDETGCYDQSVVTQNLLPNAQDFVGMHIFKANEPILEALGDALLSNTSFVHSYPHCWRSHTPLIFRATKQWFIAVDETAKDSSTSLRQTALDEIEKTQFVPSWGRNRINAMVENRPDWCISRQRDWGVPIAFFRAKATQEILFDEKVLNFIAMVIEQQGSDAWYELPIEALLYPGSGYAPDELEKVTDILDVWFDSGSTWNAVLKSRAYDAGDYPADVYLEGSDQHRGWFQSSLFLSSAIMQQAPYKTVITHGFTVDQNGEKMSKSKGNGVEPDKVIKEYGSEILRLWVALSDYQGDQKISDGILKQTADQYRKIRNTFRFLLANVEGISVLVEPKKLGALDRYILARAKEVFDEAHGLFSRYEFVHALSMINNFLVNDLSGIYLDITKDRLYCDSKNSPARQGTQSTMAYILQTMLGLFAPILTYTADEIFEALPDLLKQGGSDIFDFVYVGIPDVSSTIDTARLKLAREKFYEVVDSLKKAKQLKSTLELIVHTDDSAFDALNDQDKEDWFVVSGVTSIDYAPTQTVGTFTIDGTHYALSLAIQHKCPRCWKLQATTEDSLCQRCNEVLA